MAPEDRALARQSALARTGASPAARPAADAEAKLRALVEDITAVDAEVEELSGALAAFARGWERQVGEVFAELALAERLVLRLQRLEDALLSLADAIAAGTVPAPAGRRGKRKRPRAHRVAGRSAARDVRAGAERDGDGDGDGGADAAPEGGEAEAPPAPEPLPEVEAEEVALKRLYRRLARVLHPDLARDDAERARLGDLMARVNAAYAKGDRTALEVMAERVGAGEPPGELSEEERRAHLERRLATLAPILASLARERDRLLRSDTQRLREESARRAEEGRDHAAETRAEVLEEIAAARADALVRLDRLNAAARALARARRTRMRELEKRGPTGARRAFDPLAESDLVRQGAARLERQRATPAARAVALALEDAARAAPWEVALTALAFFAEASGGRPPDVLASAEGWAARWDGIRAGWPAAPDLARALAKLPRHLELGARADGDAVLAGLQLAGEDLSAGVRIALQRPAVAAIAREVLAALGPEEACAGCGVRGPARHLHRTRGLDTLHGLVCAACGAVLRSYWRYGEVDGLEALAPHALELGLVAEVTIALGATSIGFQLLPDEAAALTASGLARRFGDLYLGPYGVELPRDAVGVAGSRGALEAEARVADAGPLRLTLGPAAGTTEEGLLELLRSRIERRFRP